jgi:hypothetical protein
MSRYLRSGSREANAIPVPAAAPPRLSTHLDGCIAHLFLFALGPMVVRPVEISLNLTGVRVPTPPGYDRRKGRR